MSKFFYFCQANKKKYNSKERETVLVKPKIKKTVFSYYLSLSLICLIFVTGFVYVFQTTSSVTAGIKKYSQTKTINQLKLANQSLNKKINLLENLDSIKDRAFKMGFVAVKNIDYLENKNSEMAVAK